MTWFIIWLVLTILYLYFFVYQCTDRNDDGCP